MTSHATACGFPFLERCPASFDLMGGSLKRQARLRFFQAVYERTFGDAGCSHGDDSEVCTPSAFSIG